LPVVLSDNVGFSGRQIGSGAVFLRFSREVRRSPGTRRLPRMLQAMVMTSIRSGNRTLGGQKVVISSKTRRANESVMPERKSRTHR